ncbi:hypothetical protein H4F51_07975 [Pectobacterium brasiliense]|uniref:hypothetical protein n=1 Tax=Pectobacterium brasiliense TaxID=180957 RepID=UPI0015DFB54E|nr:hypothetical protein [Pectobacterium brasiliense]MBA0197829.1 hypothetical protein [Pectobacterium brasiliense]MBN3066702.1 hypothetical protein [Pectobacterium brasiliense]MBN3094147.1 hypothetical protein [Pectobacterium brasiliense]MBN3139871.1 hypothetical protein [Pectobacterium brasiliense]MBN3246064.1 hypothetical protein [Pectobacterium brasiliense]
MKKNNNKIEFFVVFVLLVIILLIASIPLFIYLLKFNGPLSSNSQEWSNLGSFLAGSSGTILSAISIFALIFTLYKSSKDAKKSHEISYLSLKLAEQQIVYMEKELKIKLFNGYIENFNESIDRKQFSLPRKVNNEVTYLKATKDEFIDRAYNWLGTALWARLSNTIVENRRGFDNHLPAIVLSEMKISFRDNLKDLYYILDTIDKCTDKELQQVLLREYHSKIDEHVLFWVMYYANMYHTNISDILKKNPFYYPMTIRCADEITLAKKCADNNSGPPHSR